MSSARFEVVDTGSGFVARFVSGDGNKHSWTSRSYSSAARAMVSIYALTGEVVRETNGYPPEWTHMVQGPKRLLEVRLVSEPIRYRPSARRPLANPTERRDRMMFRIVAVAGFIVTVLAANYVTTEYGMVPVGFGLMATAGTYFAGLAFVLRDAVQDTLGKWATLAVIVAGAGLSYFVADPFIATASGVAFAVSEVADMAVYTPLRERGYVRAAVASNVVGAFVDTVLFLWIAGFPIRSAIAGQMVGKLLVTLAVVALVIGARLALSRKPVRA